MWCFISISTYSPLRTPQGVAINDYLQVIMALIFHTDVWKWQSTQQHSPLKQGEWHLELIMGGPRGMFSQVLDFWSNFHDCLIDFYRFSSDFSCMISGKSVCIANLNLLATTRFSPRLEVSSYSRIELPFLNQNFSSRLELPFQNWNFHSMAVTPP